MNSQNKATAKSIGINLGSMTGIIAAYYGIYYAGVLDPLFDVVVWGYNLAQIIFMILIAVAVGLIIYPVIAKQKSFDEARSEIEQLLQQTTGSSEKQVKHFEDEIISDAKRKFGFHGKIKDIKAKVMRAIKRNAKVESIESIEFSIKTPEELALEFRKLKSALLSKFQPRRQIVMSTLATSENYKGEKLCIIEPINLSVSDIEYYEHYTNRSMKILLLIVGLAALVYIITYLIK